VLRLSQLSPAWRAALIGALVAAIATLPGLGTGTLWDNSETAYGEVAREILLYHDPVVLHLNGVPWFVQPPLYFWMAALFAQIFGTSEFALRLPSALATIAMGGAVGYVVARTTSSRAAILASIVLSTSLMQAIVGHLAIMDALLDLAVVVAILSWFGALRTGSRLAWYVGWIALGFGILAKGPVAPVVAFLVIAPWAWWERSAGNPIALPPARHWLGGLAAAALVIAPWAIALYHAVGLTAFGELVGHYTVGRYLGTIENQSGPIYYYIPVVILGTFPWFAFLIPAMVDGFGLARERNEGSLARLCLIWAIVPFIFFSFAQTKLPNYIALELAAFAILVATWLDDAVRRDDRRVVLAWTAVVPLTIAVVAFAVWAFSHDNKLGSDLEALRGPLSAAGWAIFIGSLLCFLLLLRKQTAWLGPFALGATSIATMWILIILVEPLAEPFKPVPRLAAVIQQNRQAGDVVAIQSVSGGNALLFYTQPPIVRIDGDPATPEARAGLKRTICEAPRAFVVTSRKSAGLDPAYGRQRRTLAVVGNDVLVLYDGPRCSG
jgi:4-amino-4-deoxy-L-arabinose transferase-like glycosyltransferase